MKTYIPQNAGFTLVDVMVTLIIMTIALIGTMSAFPTIMKSILVSKARSLANLIVLEQLEVYKNTPYYKLQVTTPTVTDSRFGDAVPYDTRYYPPEKIITGGIEYEKLTYVEKVQASSSGNFQHLDWAAPDAGMKRVYVYVIFRMEGGSGDWRKVMLSSLMENTDRQQLNSTIAGITQTTASARIPLASIYIQENPAFFTASDTSGNYTFSVPAGSWTLVTNATGYFTNVSTGIVTSTGITSTANISLSKRFLANVTGYAFIQNHLVITQIMGSSSIAGGPSGQEWIELYNPTTYNILIASRSTSTSNFDIFFVTVTWVDNANQEPPTGNSEYLLGNRSASGSIFTAFRTSSSFWNTNFSSHTIYIPPQRFFLISNFSTVTYAGGQQRIADAYYEGGDGGDIIDATGNGGIRVTGGLGYSYNGRSDWHDGVAWTGANAPSLVREGVRGANVALTASSLYTRYAQREIYASDPYSNTISLRATTANCFDSDTNYDGYASGADGEIYLQNLLTVANGLGIANVDISMPPYTGTPAVGAIVTSNDGLSAAAFVQTYGSFTLTDVTTGAWTIAIVSATPNKTYYQEIYSTVTTATPYWSIPNSLSSPQWNLSVNFSSLSLTTDKGIISGLVTGANGQGIKGITVDALAQQAQTDFQGNYRIPISPGTYNVSCNVTNTNYSYTQASSVSVVVQLGQITHNVNFSLVTSGSFQGFVTSNGVDPMPGYGLSLQKDGAEFKTGISGTDGKFLLTNVATVPVTSPYTLYCITDPGESVSPSDGIISTPTAGATIHVGTFTITSGFATFSGDVNSGSNKIETGVLLIASTQTIVTTSSGPIINSTLTSGPTVYYFAASDGQGKYQLKVLGGTRYYIYGWYKIDSGALVQKSSGPTAIISIGETKTINLQW